MVDQQGIPFDPRIHTQVPPVAPLRDGLATQPRPAPQKQQLFTQPQPADVMPAYIATARAVGQIIATRILLLICVITSSIIWCYAVWSPSDARTMAAATFSVVTMWPLTLLYWRKG